MIWGRLILPNDAVVFVETVRPLPETPNWTCSVCSTTQDSSNACCERCSLIREESEDMNLRGATLIGTTATDTLLLRCLPKGITGPRVAEGLSRVARLLPIVHIHLGKSRRFAFVQMSSEDDAKMLLACFQQAPLILDGHRVMISFSRISFTEWKAQQNRSFVPLKPEIMKPMMNAQDGVNNFANTSTPTTPAEIAEHARLNAVQKRSEMASIIQQALQAPTGPGFVQGNSAIPVVPDLTKPPPMFCPQPMQTFTIPSGFDVSQPPPIFMGTPGNLPIGMPIILPAGTFPQSGVPLMFQQAGNFQQPITMTMPSQNSQQMSLPIVQPVTSMATQMSFVQPSSIPLAPPGGVIGQIDTPFGTFPQYVAPNPSSFADEPASGYKVDMVTMFYFDPKTNYYYSNSMKKWCFWEPMYATYIPVDKKAEMALEAQKRTENNISSKAEATASEESKKSGQEIAREMLKWAKRQEKEKTKVSLTLKKDETTHRRITTSNSSSGQDVGHRVLEKMQNPLRHSDLGSSDEEGDASTSIRKQQRRQSRREPSTEDRSCRATPPTPSEMPRGVPTAQQQREEMERNLIDRPNKTCLLCRRVFPSLDVLDKHVDRSDLHRTNLELKRVEWGKAYVAQMMASLGGGD